MNEQREKCAVLGCPDPADFAFEQPMFRTRDGALSPYRNQTLIWCRKHGEYFEAERELSDRMLGRRRTEETGV
jgi:hypothetical protein